MATVHYWTEQQSHEPDELLEGEIVAIEQPVLRFLAGRPVEAGAELRLWPLGIAMPEDDRSRPVADLSRGLIATVRCCTRTASAEYLVEVVVHGPGVDLLLGGARPAEGPGWGAAAIYVY